MRIGAAAGVLAGVFAVGAIGCLQTQNLGDERVDPRADTRTPAEETGSTPPDGGFVPLYSIDFDTRKCPAVIPVQGAPCQENFRPTNPMKPVQCSYATGSYAYAQIGSLTRRMCGRSCLCGYDVRWSCLDIPCATPSKRSCSEGMPCFAGTTCGASEGAGDCTCVSGALSCAKVPTK